MLSFGGFAFIELLRVQDGPGEVSNDRAVQKISATVFIMRDGPMKFIQNYTAREVLQCIDHGTNG